MEPYFILGFLLWQFAIMNLSETIQNTYLNLNIIVNFILITILILVIVSFIKVRKKVLDLWNKNENLREENLKLLNSLASIHRAEELSEKLVDEGSVDIRKLLGFTGQFEYLNEDQAISVPPPVQMAPICPTAARVSTSSPDTGLKADASVPVNGRPEKPEPSMPEIMPTNKTPKATRK